MLPNFVFKLACALGISILTINTARAQEETELVNMLNQQLIPVTVSPTDTNFNDLEKLKPFLMNKMVFGLGEATHGTHEFFAFKHRMLEFLVKKIGVKTFVIEADFAGTQVMNDYVLYGKGDVMKGLSGMGFGIWMTREVVDMAEWIKEYNAAQTFENKVSFFGCDMQWGSSAMQFLKNYLQPRQRFTPVMEEAFIALKKYLPSLSKAEKAVVRDAVNKLTAVSFADTDSSHAALLQHYVRELQQVVEYIDAKSTFFPAKQSDLRDQCMAENCMWIFNYTGRKKMMIWAHNGHINKSSGSDGYKRMGMFLSDTLKDAYYALGFDFYSGQMRTFDMQQRKNVAVELPAGKKNSTGALFSLCRSPNFVLDFKSASANPLISQFLNSEKASVFYGASFNAGQLPHYVNHKLSDTFDGLIFIRETSAAQDMQTLKISTGN